MNSPPLDALQATTRRCSQFEVERVHILDTFGLPAHAHTGRHLMIVTEGAIVEYGQHGRCEAARGAARFSPVSEWHRIEVVEAPFSCLLVTLHPDAPAPFPEHRLLVSGTPLAPLAHSIAKNIDCNKPRDQVALSGQLFELLAQGVRAVGPECAPDVPRWLTEVRAAVEKTSARPPSLRSLANDVGVHPAHLSRAFRTHFGRTLRAFIRECRLQAAMSALEHSSATISTIAAETGFSDHAHLSRVTRAYTGLTPSGVRQLVQC